MSPKQMTYLIRYCPNVKSIKFKYLPNDADIKELKLSESRYILDEVDERLTNHSNIMEHVVDEVNEMVENEHIEYLNKKRQM